MDISEQQKLYNHIRALERLNDDMDDIREDQKQRKELAKADGFDNNVIAYVLKRRKAGDGQVKAFDHLLAEYEDALLHQKELDLDEDGNARGTIHAGTSAVQ